MGWRIGVRRRSQRGIRIRTERQPNGPGHSFRRTECEQTIELRPGSLDPAFGGAMLTLLRVRRAGHLQRRPELDGASRPLRRAGFWPPSLLLGEAVPSPDCAVAMSATIQLGTRRRARRAARELSDTNLGVRSSNLFGRASKSGTSRHFTLFELGMK